MPEFKLNQFRYESDSWKRSLDSITEENIRLKKSFSEIIKDQFDKNLIEDVKRFQNRISEGDHLISFLQDSIADIDQSLLNESFTDQRMLQHVDMKIKNLREHIIKAKSQFSHLKLALHNYLSENTIYGSKEASTIKL